MEAAEKRFDTVVFLWISAVIITVLIAISYPEAPVHRTVIKLFLFHIIGWPLAALVIYRKGIQWSSDEILLGLFCLLNIFTGFASEYPGQVQGRLINVLLFASWYFAVREFTRDSRYGEKLILVYYTAASVLSLVALLHRFVYIPSADLPIPLRIIYPVCTTNSLASILIPALLIGGIRLINTRKQAVSLTFVLTLIALILNITTFIAAKSQASLIGLLVGGAVCGWVLWFRNADTPGRKKLIILGSGMLLSGIIAAVLIYPLLGGTFVVRKMCWPAGIDIISAHMLGSGPGSAAARIPDYLDPVWKITQNFGAAVYHIHNEYLEVGIETGAAGLLVFLGFLVLIFKAYFSSPKLTILQIAAGGGLLGICIEMNASVNMRFWTVPMVFWLFAALSPPVKGIIQPDRRKKTVACIAVCVMGAAAFFNVFLSWRAHLSLEKYLKEGRESTRLLRLAKQNTLVTKDTLRAIGLHVLMNVKNKAEPEVQILTAWGYDRYIPDYLDSTIDIARWFYLDGKYERALEYAIKGFKYNPFSGKLWKAAALSSERVAGITGKESADDIHTALRRISVSRGMDLNVSEFIQGLVLSRHGHYREAFLAFTRAQQYGGHVGRIAEVPAAEVLGLNSPETVKALEIIEKYLAGYPQHREARNIKGALLLRFSDTLVKQKKYEEALFCLQNAHELNPEDKEILERINKLKAEIRN